MIVSLNYNITPNRIIKDLCKFSTILIASLGYNIILNRIIKDICKLYLFGCTIELQCYPQ